MNCNAKPFFSQFDFRMPTKMRRLLKIAGSGIRNPTQRHRRPKITRRSPVQEVT